MIKEKANTVLDPFDSNIHRFGRISGSIIFLLMIIFPFILSSVNNLFPDFTTLISPIITVSLIMVTFSIAEIIAYPPIMGAASVYMSYVTGNVTNLKMPCAISTMSAAGVDHGTDEGDAISMIAVGISTLTVIVVVLISIFLLKFISPILSNPALKPSFDNVMPALIGGLGSMVLSSKDKIKLAIVPLIISFIGIYLLALNTGFVLPVSLVTAIIIGRVLYKKKML